jgi:hypothetical protein
MFSGTELGTILNNLPLRVKFEYRCFHNYQFFGFVSYLELG